MYEWPSAVVTFVTEARRILSYITQLPEDQQPPKAYWHSPKKCSQWIKDHAANADGRNRSKSNMLDLDDLEVEK